MKFKSTKNDAGPPSRVSPVHLFAAAALLGLLTMPIGLAQGGGESASSSAVTNAKFKKLKKRLAALEARPATPTGPAGGDLIGTYPNPTLSPSVTARLKGSCPADMNRVGDSLCIEKVAGDSETWSMAANNCASLGRRLPSISELLLADESGLLALQAGYWTDVAFRVTDVGGQLESAVRVIGGFGSGSAETRIVNAATSSACVSDPSVN